MERLTRQDPQRLRKHCIWMQAGVVRQKYCKMDYGCEACRFDMDMRRIAEKNRALREAGITMQGNRGNIISWKEKMRHLPVSRRPCIHHMKGRIEFRACSQNYFCGNCDFDQYFHDQYVVHAVMNPVDVLEVSGFNIPQGYYFHTGHAWVKLEEGSSVRVGLDDFALRLLGPLDRIEAPLMGKEVVQGRADTTIYRGENKAAVLSPVSGVVTAVNAGLREEASRAGQDPYAEGWFMHVHTAHLRQDLKNLMIHSETGRFIAKEAERLYGVIEKTGGPLATDGGNLGHDIYGKMPKLGWDRLTRLFLRGGT